MGGAVMRDASRKMRAMAHATALLRYELKED
jgi:hypothetical protein